MSAGRPGGLVPELGARPVRAVTLDTLTAGVHFTVATPLEDVGYKALAVNLSDLAAMGARPLHARLHVEGPEAVTRDAGLEMLLVGVSDAARDAGVSIGGADDTLSLSCSPADTLSLSLQATGEVLPGMALRRDGARAGDAVFVSGALGEAAAGLRVALHGLDLPQDGRIACATRLNRPQPRVALGRALAGIATAAIDVSDGLVADLGHILAASGLDATLTLDNLPLGDGLSSLPHDEALAFALGGGDDYELCFTVALRHRPLLAGIARRTGVDLTEIGATCRPANRGPGGAITLLDATGRPVAPPAGFAHFPGGGAAALHFPA